MDNTEIYSDSVREISSIDFAIFTNEEVYDLSALKSSGDKGGIIHAELYDKSEPKMGGLNDLHLGTNRNDLDCATCGLDTKNCPGHFGHMYLANYVYHPKFFLYTKKILSCICIRCSRLLINRKYDDLMEMLKEFTGKNRLNKIKKIIESVKYCSEEYAGCGTPVVQITERKQVNSGLVNLYAISSATGPKSESEAEIKKDIELLLTPTIIYNMFSNIPDEHCKILGLRQRPEKMIIKILPVPPTQIRPTTKADFGGSNNMEDDLTIKLNEIFKSNLRIIETKEKEKSNIDSYTSDYRMLLQYNVDTYIDNESKKIPKSLQKDRVLKSISTRLKGKEGRIRNNLMGKRVNFSARTVITPDPTLSINEVGCPIKIAMDLTFPEIVTPYNIVHLQKLVKNGRYIYPGANFVKLRNDNNFVDLRFIKETIKLNFGDIVERHLVNGDWVLLNRQPTLQKQSMMAHKLKVINNPNLKTFRLSIAVVKPYNADFDGDEMNIFIGLSIQTTMELEEIADVKKQIITPNISKVIIGLAQDGLLGAYELTSPMTVIGWKESMNLITYTSFNKFKTFEKNRTYKGTELFSMMLPKDINIYKNNLVIENSIMKSGQLRGEFLAPKKANAIHQIIWDKHGENETKNYIDDLQRLTNNYIMYRGFTVGIYDINTSKEAKTEINTIISTKELEVCHQITEIENNPQLMDEELFEKSILSNLNIIRDNVSKYIGSKMTPLNNFKIMMESDAKGDLMNSGQIAGSVGLQVMEGVLVQKKINKRSSIYSVQNDDRAESRGLIRNSFVNGLTFLEMYYHCMTSRYGLIEGAVKTAESGYIQRKLTKFMEDGIIKYDNTLRSASNMIIQFIYGDSGTDATRQYPYVFKMMDLGNREMALKYSIKEEDFKKYKTNAKENEIYLKKILEMRDSLRSNRRKALLDYKIFDAEFQMPLNMTRIISDAVHNESLKTGEIDLDVPYILESLEKILNNKYTKLVCMESKDQNNPKSIKYQDEQTAKTTFKYSLHDSLAPAKCIYEYKFNKLQFDSIIEDIVSSFNKNLAEAGEMVGVVAAQSLGEPTTQMTLKAFHTAGIVAISNTTQGVQRIKELLSASQNIKTPGMLIVLVKDYQKNKEIANKIAAHIKYTTIKHLRKSITVYYDPEPKGENNIMEKDNIKNAYYTKTSPSGCQSDITHVPWVIRIEFDKEKMLEKTVTLLDIKSKFCNSWEKRNIDIKTIKKDEKVIIPKITQIAVLSNTDNDDTPIIHIRFDMIEYSISFINEFIDTIIDKFILKGIQKISNIDAVVEERQVTFDNENQENQVNNQWVIYTAGVNNNDIRYIKGVDIYNTMSNDVYSNYITFGIEAARASLINEITQAYERSGQKVNYQHIITLADYMTCFGYISPIDRHGMNKSDIDPLSRSSFENTIEHLTTAAVFNERDNMTGISAKIMAGQVIRGGTGLCDLILDTELLQKSEYTEDIGQKFKPTYIPIQQSSINEHFAETNEEESEIFMPEE